MWDQCIKCKYFLPKKEISLHSCSINEDDCKISSRIGKNNFHGILKLVGKTPTAINIGECTNSLFLHPSVMKICQFHIGSYATLEIEKQKFIKRVYPTLEEEGINYCILLKEGLNLSSLSNRQYVKVSPFNDSCLPAQEIHINFENENIEFNEIDILKKHCYRRIIKEEEIIVFHYRGKFLKIFIKKIIPIQHDSILKHLSNLNISKKQYYTVVANTEWKIHKANIQEITKTEKIFSVGNEQLLLDMKNMLNMGFSKSVKHLRYKPKGILLFGPPGSGKTTLCFTLADTINAFVIIIKEEDIFSKLFDEAGKTLNELFLQAKIRSPSLVIIDNIEKLFPKKSSNDLHRRILSILLNFLDDLEQDDNSSVMFIGITSNPEEVHSSLRRSGRFHREYELEPPDIKKRCKILEFIIFKKNNNINKEEIEYISNRTGGFVAADLVLLCNSALQLASKENKTLCQKHFLSALCDVKPNTMREVKVTIPKVKWTDIGGQSALKMKLEQAVIWPLKYPESLKRFGINPPKGFLLFGPPGCSKTLIAQALASESKLNFLHIKGPEIFSKWVGESERAVQQLFRRARRVSPSIVFFDEIDAIASKRSNSGGGASDAQGRVLTQLLTELDGVEPLGDVIVVGATNRPDKIDPALLRPGRLAKFYVPLPDKNTRREILSITFSKMSINDDVNIEYLVENTEGFSGAEVHSLCQQAGWTAFGEDKNIKDINFSHFLKALTKIQPATRSFLIDIYNQFINKSS